MKKFTYRGTSANGTKHTGTLYYLMTYINEAILSDKNDIHYTVSSTTLQRFTGLHDSNLKQIYEGNKVSHTSDSKHFGIVEWSDISAAFIINLGGGDAAMLEMLHDDLIVTP